MTDHRADLRNAVDAFLGSGSAGPGALWQGAVELGLPWIGIAETDGGSGGTFGDLCVVLEQAGYHGVDLPINETATASWVVAGAGLRLPAGMATLVLGQAQDQGQLTKVPWGHQAEQLVVVGRRTSAPEVSVEIFDRTALVTRPGANLAGEPRDEVTIDESALVAVGTADLSLEVIRYRFAISASQLILGAVQRVLDLSLDHASSRTQFGRPLARFQAIQHQLAELAGTVRLTAAITAAGVAAAEAGDWLNPVVVAARVQSAVTATTAIRIGHQVHGALGFTLEHPLNRSTRRLMSWRDENGGEASWQQRLGSYAATAGGKELWRSIVADPASPSS